MPDPCYDTAPLWYAVLGFAAFVALIAVEAVCPSVWSRLAALGSRLYAALDRPVECRPLEAACAAPAVAWRAVRVAARWLAFAPVYAFANRCDWFFGWLCYRRAERAVYSGVTLYEEWREEAAALPSYARLSMMAEISPYRPSAKLVKRARSLRGRNCLLTRAAEREREAARRA